MTDDESILFPSVTICKDEMFDNEIYSDSGLLSRLQSGEVSAENARSWFLNRTFSRERLVKFLSLKTVEGSNNYPCNTGSGPRAGEPCAFPYFYPDCNLTKKVPTCHSEPEISRQTGPLSLVEECRGSSLIGRELGQQSYAIKNQLGHPKPPTTY